MDDYAESNTIVVHQPHTGLWVMDCFGPECWQPYNSPYAEFKTKTAAEKAATGHRAEHAAEIAAQLAADAPCSHCGAPARFARPTSVAAGSTGRQSA